MNVPFSIFCASSRIAALAKPHIKTMEPPQLAALVRSCCRVRFVKHSLLNAVARAVVRRHRGAAKTGDAAAAVAPRLLAQFLLDLAKLGYLKPELLAVFRPAIVAALPRTSTFDLVLLAAVFQRLRARDAAVLAPLCDQVLERVGAGDGGFGALHTTGVWGVTLRVVLVCILPRILASAPKAILGLKRRESL